MSPRIKLTVVMLVPILLGGIIGTTLIWQWAEARTTERATHFAEAVIAQVSQTVTDPLLQEDALSLNVILSDLVRRGDVSFASVYSADNRLMAQAGRRSDAQMLFNHDVSFQNTSAGYVQLGLSRDDVLGSVKGVLSLAIGTWAALALVFAGLVWFYGDLIYLWLGSSGARIGSPGQDDDETEPEAAPEPIAIEQTILVIKIRPARQLDAHFDTVMRAIALYGGEAVTDGDDVIVTFKRSEQLTKATCTSGLVQALMSRARGNIAVKCGMHLYASDDEPSEIEKARKHASYLASIAEDALLVSRRIFSESAEGNASGREGVGQLHFEAFHSSLTPDGEVFLLVDRSDARRQLINRQAEQL